MIIWEFAVREEHVEEFTAAYAADGDWANLFRRARGYVDTRLLRSAETSNLFLTIDRWESAACFEIFQEQFGAEYRTLDARFAGFTVSEKKLGVFSEE